MSDPVLLESRDGAIVTLVLNRPDKMNALNRALITALGDTFRRLSQDPDLRAIILTGAGRAFCGGLDLKELAASGNVAAALDWQGPDSLIDTLRACPHPVIAAVNGFAITGGLELALMADFILASQSARFADTHARVGITPSWGMTQVLPRLIGANRARQMSLTGEFVDAARAADWGLVTEVVADDALLDRVGDLARQIAETDAPTLRTIRALIGQSGELGLTDGLAAEAAHFKDHIAHISGASLEARRQAVTARGQQLNETRRNKIKT